MSGESCPRLIIRAHPDDYGLAIRAARFVLADDYEWSTDGWASIAFGEDYSNTFNVKRNKSGLTVIGPRRDHDTDPEAMA